MNYPMMGILIKCFIRKSALPVYIYLFILSLAAVDASFAQKFNSGKIGIELSSIGRIIVFSPLSRNQRQVYRISLVAGADKNNVFSYIGDQDSLWASVNVLSPGLSDYEIRGAINNSFSNQPPELTARFNIYGWSNEPYALVKVTIVNTDNLELKDINPFIGFEYLPQVDSTFGFETIKYNRDVGTVLSFRPPSSTITGIKMLPGSLSSLRIVDWKDYYEKGSGSDSIIYSLMSSGIIDSALTGGPLGAACLLSGSPFKLRVYDSAVVYLAIAVGTTEAEVLENIKEAGNKFMMPLSVENPASLAQQFHLEQNYPNPFNPSTGIRFSIPLKNHVSLKVYDLTGRVVALLIDSEMEAGAHNIKFDSQGLASGVYFLRLESGPYHQTRKMISLK